MKKWIAGLIASLVASPLFAQSSSTVTLYGIIDTGIGYQSSSATLGSTSGGRSAVKMVNGVWAGNRFGIKGNEDLGAGNHAIFQLEAGYNSTTGASSTSGVLFNRGAYVGISNDTYGALTAGRQYASYYQLLSAYSPTTWLTGYFGAHPGDLDGLDTIYRASNTIEYTSQFWHGLRVSGSYSLGGVAGSVNRGSTWSAAVQYAPGPFGAAVGVSRVNNSTPGGGPFGTGSTTSNAGAQIGVSAVTNGYQSAQAQQRFTLATGYTFTSTFDVSATYSNVQYIPGVNSSFESEAIFNTGGIVLHWKPAVSWDFSLGYSYTKATKANGITSSASYHQFNLTEYYSLSKRTGLYLLQAYQRASGSTLGSNGRSIIEATAVIGDGLPPSSSSSMFAVGAGIVHRF
jgi:predicted porin